MSLLSFMFSSDLDQSALVIMAVGLALNAILDIVRSRRAATKPPA